MMLMVLNESKHTVDFFGYCGGLYVVEKVSFVASDVFGNTWELIDLSLLPDVFEPLQKLLNDYGNRAMNLVGFSLLKMARNLG